MDLLVLVHLSDIFWANNYSLREMPEELFLFDQSVSMNNPIITAQALNYYNYLCAAMEQEQFDLVLEVLHENESREMD